MYTKNILTQATHLTRVESLKVLGVTFNSKLSFEPHISYIVQSAASSFYGLKTLRAHGLTGKSLKDVTQTTLIARIMYAIPAWWGFLNVAEKDRIESVIKKGKRYGYLPSDFETAHSLVESMESKLFDSVRYNTNHVLHQLLPPVKDIHYNLRQRSHCLTLPSEDNNLIRKNFLHKMLFRDIY